jgi:hypothetical protein
MIFQRPENQLPTHHRFWRNYWNQKTSAQITKRYSNTDLLPTDCCRINFPKKQIGKFMSECLVLGAVGNEEDVILLAPDFKIENGPESVNKTFSFRLYIL